VTLSATPEARRRAEARWTALRERLQSVSPQALARGLIATGVIGLAVGLAVATEQLSTSPRAARYDLEQARIRVAEQLAGNSRAVVSLGGSELLGGLLRARETADAPK
jgi:tetrahydromethanopterin S-methyltransferase subunit F